MPLVGSLVTPLAPLPCSDFSCGIVAAHEEFSFIIDNADLYAIEPTTPAQHVAAKAVERGEINCDSEAEAECGKRDLVAVGQERSGGGAYALLSSAFDVEPEGFAMLTLENADAGAGVELGQNPSPRRAAL